MHSTREVTTLRDWTLAVTLVFALAAMGCGGGKPKGEAPKPAPTPKAAAPTPAPTASAPVEVLSQAAKDEAAQAYATRCTPCHGDTGKGDGAAAAALNPKPRDYSSKEWQASVTDEHIEKVIIGGGPAVGMSFLMPPNPDLAAKPEVVKALRAHVRDLGR